MIKRAILFFVAGLLFFQGICFSAPKKIAMVIAFNNFRDEELLVPKKVFEDEGFIVEVFSSNKGVAKGMLGTEFKVDKVISQITPQDFDAIVFVGGIGAQTYWNNSQVLNLAKEFYEEGKVVGAICLAPVILANAGILENKRATVWVSAKGELEKKGCIYGGEGVIVEGRIVTASGPVYAKDFALKIVELLK